MHITDLSRWAKEWLMEQLQQLDDYFFNTPGNELPRQGDTKTTRILKMADRTVFSLLRGGPRRHPTISTGNPVKDWLHMLDCRVARFVNRMLIVHVFNGRGIQTKSGLRVRSRSERRIAEMFDGLGLTYRYEDPLAVGGIVLHPDFHLPNERVFVEFWGMMDIPRYAREKKRRTNIYKEHGIKVISLFPRDLDNLKKKFAEKFQKATGKPLPGVST